MPMFIRLFEKELCGVIDGKNIILTKNSKNNALHFRFNGSNFEDIETFESNVLIKKIPKTETHTVDVLPFYSILFDHRELFIAQPMSKCHVLVVDEVSDAIIKKDIVSLVPGDIVVFYDEEFDDFILKDVEDVNIFNAVDEQFIEDEEDLGFSGYIVGAESGNGLILNNLLLI